MKKLNSWQVTLGVSLVLVSIILYAAEYFVFRDARGILFGLLSNTAFLPIEVLLVTLIIQQLLEQRSRADRMEKLNMVIGAFFSEAGAGMMKTFYAADRKKEDMENLLDIKADCPESEFDRLSGYLKSHGYEVMINSEFLEGLKKYLLSKRMFLLRLLENPNLLEHEGFTDLLRATFHLTEELESRESLKELPASDYEHQAKDIKRVYSLLVGEWLNYMKHLRTSYPYLFSLSVRTNPFDPKASVIIR